MNILMQIAGGTWEPLRDLRVYKWWDMKIDVITARHIEYLFETGASWVTLDCAPEMLNGRFQDEALPSTVIVRYKLDR